MRTCITRNSSNLYKKEQKSKVSKGTSGFILYIEVVQMKQQNKQPDPAMILDDMFYASKGRNIGAYLLRNRLLEPEKVKTHKQEEGRSR